MNIKQRLAEGAGFTPTEEQLALTILSLDERVQTCSIKELARMAHVSIASVHRLCKKLGVEGFKEFKVAYARASAHIDTIPHTVDTNFPFCAGDGAHVVLDNLESLYVSTLKETRMQLNADSVDRAAALMARSSFVDVYTQSHNLYPASMFCDRLRSTGTYASCYDGIERQTWQALNSDANHVAICISYSGLSPNVCKALPLLAQRNVPVFFIGRPETEQMHPGLYAYLHLGTSEALQNRITQFASHLAVQYVLDSLFSCCIARDFERSLSFLEQSLPYTALPGTKGQSSLNSQLAQP